MNLCIYATTLCVLSNKRGIGFEILTQRCTHKYNGRDNYRIYHSISLDETETPTARAKPV